MSACEGDPEMYDCQQGQTSLQHCVCSGRSSKSTCKWLIPPMPFDVARSSVPTEHPGKISSGPTTLFGVPGITGHTICRTLITPALHRTSLASVQPCITPALHHTSLASHQPCITPALHHTSLASLQPCITPALHHSSLASH